ncbi:hypothetical protein TRFO_10968 [Tritrichomonas foetus]|uniref:Sel1 repeat family protein n=1 Tax=Tritrichomonas foetus TaxID=1144522 RepID=A0A1J4J7H4_9EUKA|nr:hypothetical protein TRFO_10968 [Tritrichomonas foetus]|eukprot:OHS94601.1 hypothetical protein TRFO_10968 [Tritrichomonas foetus]
MAVYQTITLYTTNKVEDSNPQPFVYYLDYSYDQLLDVAITNLKLSKTKDYVILFRNATNVPRWMLRNETLRTLSAQAGNMIHILPADIQSHQQPDEHQSYEFQQNENGDQATLIGADGEVYRFKEDDGTVNEEDETVDFGGLDPNSRTPQPSANSQIEILLRSGRTPEREAEIHKMGAENGLPDEQFQWALCLKEGYGTSKDIDEAAKWMKLAAVAGNAKALCNFGMMLRDGTGVEKNIQQALVYFKRSADKGYPVGQYSYGALLMKGEGIERDPEQAFAYIQAAAEQGEEQAVEYMSHFA